ncbi:MAG: DegT/DnrJ/EryC1/StrS family aminotransferase, partial [Nitrososphaeria archaeon]|nr:DegT/DnrJ/EryC1/StrS family aminotransferase [Nitrososphaeria archaeon]
MTSNNVFNKKNTKVSAYEPWISENDKKLVLSSLNQTMLTLGPNLEKFERMFAKYAKTKDAVAVSNCTAALHLSLMALGIKKGDEVIIPDLTFIADANAALAVGAKPVLADIDDDFSISIASIKKKVSKNTKAIIPVHIYGKACNIDEILDVAKANNIKVVEDCAHAVGTFYKGKHVGGFGETGCFSFYPTKNMTTAEGGMVTTNSLEIAEKIRQLRSHGMTRSLSDRYKKGYPW